MMAGRGPAPKLPELRRNFTKPQAGEWIKLPSEGRKGPVPLLPKHLGLSRATHEWWKRVWKTPSALMWTKADFDALVGLAILWDKYLDGKTSLASEIRLREAEFGLSPAGRQQRRWLIVDEVEPEQAADQLAEQRRRTERRKELAKKLG